MKKLNLIIACCFLVSGCAVVKTPTISVANQDDGKIQMTYTYGLFEKPDVKWNDTLNSASAQCKAWGYQDAQQTVAPQKSCTKEDQNGNCTNWQVDSLYECKLSSEQQIALNEKKQKAIQAQQEEERKQQEIMAKKYPYQAVLGCKTKYGQNVATYLCFAGRGSNSIFPYGTEVEVMGSNETKTYNRQNISSELLIIPIEKNYSLFAKNSRDDLVLYLEVKKTSTGEVIERQNAGFGQTIHSGS